jgi:hypothetical protein
MQEGGRNGLTTKKARENGEGGRDGLAYSCLLKNELLGASIEDVKGQCDERRALVPLEGMNLFQVQNHCVCARMCVRERENKVVFVQTLEACGRVDVLLHIFFSWMLNRGKWSFS